ncbi:Transcription initiation factor TFIID [Spraguea lophii 42_110]|uniref:Transcription initiation factor TFIID n=1 Tax=Spraguea lophii (strain 42_110) TaxID=1358809 RepID=S7W8Z3_SPRLO|nr:Transcription initiation factor TFIID [Spraguea lophii 42_110]
MPETTAPREAKIVSIILRSIGIDECEPQVIVQILEFLYKYSVDVMEDALLYAEHNERKIINVDDIKLALQSKVGKYFVPPPPKSFIEDIAKQVNAKPLMINEQDNLIKIPPQTISLLAQEYSIDENKEHKNIN